MKKVQPKVTLYDAKDARDVPMRRLLEVLGVWQDKRGNVRCPFPGHHKNGDAHPSARVFLPKNKLHCFVSGESWSVRAGEKEHHFCRFGEQQPHRRGRGQKLYSSF